MKLKKVRLSFPSIFKKATFQGQETKYEATFLVPKGDPQAKLVQSELDNFIKETFAGKPVPKALKITCWQDGNTKDYDGYEGMMALKASTTRRPLVVDRDKTPLSEEDGVVYAGCYVNAIVSFWYSDHPLGGKQILCNLEGLQFAADGESFGAKGADADDFDFEDESEDDSY